MALVSGSQLGRVVPQGTFGCDNLGGGHVHGILRVEAGYTARQKHLTVHRTVPATTKDDPAPNVSRADVEKRCATGTGTKTGAQIGIWTLVEMLSGLKNLPAKVLFQKVSIFGLLNPSLSPSRL